MEKKKYQVSILNIDKENSSVDIKFGGGSEGTFQVVDPAKIDYAREGDAEITIANDQITYLRSGSSGSNSGGFKPKSNFQSGSTFKAKESDPNVQKIIVKQHCQKVAIEVLKAYQAQESTNEVFASYPDYVVALVDVAHQLEEDIFKI